LLIPIVWEKWLTRPNSNKMFCSKCGYNNPPTLTICKNCEKNLAQGFIGSDRQDIPEAILYAGFWWRLLAVFLDVLVILSGVLLLLFAIAGMIAITGQDSILHTPLAISIFYWTVAGLSAAYFILLESGANGATLGKRWLNIMIQDTQGSRLTLFNAVNRQLARVFSCLIFFTGFLIQPFTKRKQALHDLLAGTVVVKRNTSNKISIMATLLVLFMALMVPVLALLATAGQPLFEQYVQTVQVNAAIKTGRAAASKVARFYRNNGRVPVDLEDAGGKTNPSAQIAKIEINQQNGEITLTFSETVRKDIRNRHLIFTPSLEADQSIGWKCRSTDIETRFLPDSCS
jgi:uncharacterized RDD family membrane protein YckC